jgi:hypothetical protein
VNANQVFQPPLNNVRYTRPNVSPHYRAPTASINTVITTVRASWALADGNLVQVAKTLNDPRELHFFSSD